MLEGALALLAARGITDPSEDALLGGLMEADFQAKIGAWFDCWIKAHSKGNARV